MPRPEKVQAVADIKESLEESEAVFLTEYRGLSVKAVQELRANLRASGAEYKVVKMTLARLAAGDAGITGLDEYLLGPTALAFAKSDPVATAKALKDFSKSHDVFVLKAGVLSGNILSPEEVSRLADIEPREVNHQPGLRVTDGAGTIVARWTYAGRVVSDATRTEFQSARATPAPSGRWRDALP